jgi:hypothetical protein
VPKARTTTHNWLLWDAVLKPGTYTWQVNARGKEPETSEPRRFTITPDAVPFVVPGPGTIVVRARSTARPRTWARDSASALNALKSERAKGFKTLVDSVWNDEKRFEAEPTSQSLNSNYNDAVSEQKRTLAAALAWAGTHERRFGEDAARRLMAQAAWSTTGPIAYKTNDMASRTVAWTLALGFDWTYDYLSAQQKQAITAAIRARTQPMFEDIMKRITVYPYDSHGNVTLNVVAAIGVLMAGEIVEADDWVKEAVPAAVAWTSPWGWQDGGFANGTAQAFWDTGSNLTVWYVLRDAAGVDLSKKEWVRNHARFLAYFVPPGRAVGGLRRRAGDAARRSLVARGQGARRLRALRRSRAGTREARTARTKRAWSCCSRRTRTSHPRVFRRERRTPRPFPPSAGSRCTAASRTRIACRSSSSRAPTARTTTAMPTRTPS